MSWTQADIRSYGLRQPSEPRLLEHWPVGPSP